MKAIKNRKDKRTRDKINNYHTRLMTYNTNQYLFSVAK